MTFFSTVVYTFRVLDLVSVGWGPLSANIDFNLLLKIEPCSADERRAFQFRLKLYASTPEI